MGRSQIRSAFLAKRAEPAVKMADAACPFAWNRTGVLGEVRDYGVLVPFR